MKLSDLSKNTGGHNSKIATNILLSVMASFNLMKNVAQAAPVPPTDSAPTTTMASERESGIQEKTLRAVFEKAAGHIEGVLMPLLETEAAALIGAQNDRLEALAMAALPENATDARRKAILDYVTALSLSREKPGKAALSEVAALGAGTIKALTRDKLAGLTKLEMVLKEQLGNSARQETPAERELFGSRDRLYFRLDDRSVSSVRPYVAAFLRQNGYEITDYNGGYATNDGGKNIRKIGKLLASLENVPVGLAQAFEKDFCRYNRNLMVVLTRDPGDIARGSFGRGWESCRADSLSAASHGAREHGAGVIAAYLVRESDPQMHDPLGRVFLKPYDNTEKKTVYFTFNPIGLHCPGFVDAVNNLAESRLNGDSYGAFSLRRDCESYREMFTRMRLPTQAEAALKILDVKFRKSAGRIVVDGDIDLANKGLARLPDFSDVIVKGGMDVSGNKLLTLSGLPQDSLEWLRAKGTLISSFAGCTPVINGAFSYVWSAYLESAQGAPQAASYEYGGGYGESGFKKAQEPICPIAAPADFPRFKRA